MLPSHPPDGRVQLGFRNVRGRGPWPNTLGTLNPHTGTGARAHVQKGLKRGHQSPPWGGEVFSVRSPGSWGASGNKRPDFWGGVAL